MSGNTADRQSGHVCLKEFFENAAKSLRTTDGDDEFHDSLLLVAMSFRAAKPALSEPRRRRGIPRETNARGTCGGDPSQSALLGMTRHSPLRERVSSFRSPLQHQDRPF